MTGISEPRGRRAMIARCALQVAAVAAVLSAATANAQFVESEFRASDGTAYQVVRVLPSMPNTSCNTARRAAGC